MQVTVELEDHLFKSLQQDAAMRGESSAAYIRTALQDRLSAQHHMTLGTETDRVRLAELYLARLQEEGPTLGREGMPWREFVHQGHGR